MKISKYGLCKFIIFILFLVAASSLYAQTVPAPAAAAPAADPPPASSFGVAQILSIIALLLTIVVGLWVKLMTSRAFKGSDDKMKELDTSCKGLDVAVRSTEIDVAKIKTLQEQQVKDITAVKADMIREVQLMVNQVESVHKKIDHMDEKLDKLRDRSPK